MKSWQFETVKPMSTKCDLYALESLATDHTPHLTVPARIVNSCVRYLVQRSSYVHQKRLSNTVLIDMFGVRGPAAEILSAERVTITAKIGSRIGWKSWPVSSPSFGERELGLRPKGTTSRPAGRVKRRWPRWLA